MLALSTSVCVPLGAMVNLDSFGGENNAVLAELLVRTRRSVHPQRGAAQLAFATPELATPDL